MNVERLKLDQIEVGERLRAVDEDYAALLAESMAEHGLRTPIEVRRTKDGFRLMTGAHRLRAARLLGWTEIEAIEREIDDIGAEIAEIDENLIRRELTEMDRATFLARRKELHEQLHPETRHGGARGREGASGQIFPLARRFTAEVAEKLHLSERTIRRAVQRHHRLAPDVRAALAGSRFADHGATLDQLAREHHDVQRKVVQMLLAPEHPLPSVRVALDTLMGKRRPAVVDPETRQYEQLLSAWRKAGAAPRRQFVEFLEREGAVGKSGARHARKGERS